MTSLVVEIIPLFPAPLPKVSTKLWAVSILVSGHSRYQKVMLLNNLWVPSWSSKSDAMKNCSGWWICLLGSLTSRKYDNVLLIFLLINSGRSTHRNLPSLVSTNKNIVFVLCLSACAFSFRKQVMVGWWSPVSCVPQPVSWSPRGCTNTLQVEPGEYRGNGPPNRTLLVCWRGALRRVAAVSLETVQGSRRFIITTRTITAERKKKACPSRRVS